MADPAQKPKRVGQQLEPNILGSSIYETKRYWVPVSTNILGSSIYETSTGYQQRDIIGKTMISQPKTVTVISHDPRFQMKRLKLFTVESE